jgi:hypothetical protein
VSPNGEFNIEIGRWKTVRTSTAVRLVKYVFPSVGLILLVISVFVYYNTRQFVERSITTTGKVIDMKTDDTYHPVVEFRTADDETLQFTSSTGSKPPAYRVGQEVEVLYDPASPHSAQIKSFMSLWFFVVAMGGLGFIFCVVGFAIGRISRIPMKESPS